MTGAVLGHVHAPDGPAYTIVLVLHVAAALIGLVSVAASGVEGARLATAHGEPPEAVRAYFSPGVNWLGRTLYLVPALGAALLAMSGGAYRAGDAWVLGGIGLWVGAIAIAEAVLWPAERRVRQALRTAAPAASTARRGARTLCAAAGAVATLLVAAMVVMVAKP